VPCMYTYFDDFQLLIKRVWAWRPFRAASRGVTTRAPGKPRLEERGHQT